MANKNRIQPPSKIVHFFNTPPDLSEETVNRVFVERGIEAPTTVKLFPLKSERSSSGLIEFSSVGVAVAAIMECNHTALENSSKFPLFTSVRALLQSEVGNRQYRYVHSFVIVRYVLTTLILINFQKLVAGFIDLMFFNLIRFNQILLNLKIFKVIQSTG